MPPGVSKYSFDSEVASSHPQAFKHVKTLKGRTRDEGDHWVKVLFNGHIDPPVPVVIDAKVGVVDLNNQLLHVCSQSYSAYVEISTIQYSSFHRLTAVSQCTRLCTTWESLTLAGTPTMW